VNFPRLRAVSNGGYLIHKVADQAFIFYCHGNGIPLAIADFRDGSAKNHFRAGLRKSRCHNSPAQGNDSTHYSPHKNDNFINNSRTTMVIRGRRKKEQTSTAYTNRSHRPPHPRIRADLRVSAHEGSHTHRAPK
jgi:hypothetical protein